jgi:hypothetical protein
MMSRELSGQNSSSAYRINGQSRAALYADGRAVEIPVV